ncbi:MAG: ABC transporter ATP-binding protein, partial [Dermabacter sp.]|nr:ABC transporter ATP-binding protein [Dermabacter sp.]
MSQAVEEEDHELTKEENRASRKRSLTLLRELLAPEKGSIVLVAIMVVLAQAAVVAGPAILAWGIDNGLPALIDGDALPALGAAGLHATCAIVAAALTFVFTRQSSVIGQRLLLELRRRVFRHTQRLSLEFHE